jgi:hypothetical protein
MRERLTDASIHRYRGPLQFVWQLSLSLRPLLGASLARTHPSLFYFQFTSSIDSRIDWAGRLVSSVLPAVSDRVCSVLADGSPLPMSL